MTAPALAAAQEGNRYQYRFFWRVALPMLYETAPPRTEKVVMEHRAVEVVDDVVVYWSAPGINDAGKFVRVDFYQIKFHVAHGQSVSAENLIDPEWSGTKHSILWRFAASWKELREAEPNIRLTLITNWPWCPTDAIASLLRDSGRLHESFFTSRPASAVGRIRDEWRGHLSLLTDDEFAEFIARLRVRTQAVSQSEAGEWLADRCQLAGLQPPDLTTGHSPYDDLAGRLLADGRREFTGEQLEKIVDDEKLRLQVAPPFEATCAIRSFRRFAHEPTTDGMLVIDLTGMFDGRELIDRSGWSVIRQTLDNRLREVTSLTQPVQIALDAHLSIGWYAGTILDSKAGLPLLLRQKGYSGVSLWDTGVTRPADAELWRVAKQSMGEGRDLAISISLTHDVFAQVRSQLASVAPDVRAIVDLRSPNVGPASIKDGAHACQLADELVRTVRALSGSDGVRRTHIFAACPVSFAFILGQRSAALGPTTMYEYDFGRTGTYSPALGT